MTQYHYFKINPASSLSSPSTSSASYADMPSTAPSVSMLVDALKQQKRYKFHSYQHRQPVYSNNSLSPISLTGPSFINASPINNIKLPSIKELDNMIINPNSTNEPITATPTTMRQLPPIMPVTTTKRLSSVIVEQERRTGTTQNIRPLKRQNNENKRKLKPYPTKQQCHSCNSTETPEWRKGPLGPRTLCNACGLIWTKLCKQNEEDNQNKEASTTSDSSLHYRHHLSPLSSPASSHASSSASSSSSSNGDTKKSINCQKYTLSFLLT